MVFKTAVPFGKHLEQAVRTFSRRARQFVNGGSPVPAGKLARSVLDALRVSAKMRKG